MLTGPDLRAFFQRYVAGTEELPYDELFATVGLKLNRQARNAADAGFIALRNFDGPLLVTEVTGAAATSAGVRAGDEIVQVDGKLPPPDFAAHISSKDPGDKIRVELRRGRTMFAVQLTLASKQTEIYRLDDAPNLTRAQRDRRAAWLASEDEPSAAASSLQTEDTETSAY
jgi:predicted metalloprotease with PDZ domain